jgi:hypothetical protein
MLTSHLLLLGSFIAVFCATGIASPQAYAQSACPQSALTQSIDHSMDNNLGQSIQQSLPQAATDQESHHQQVDVSYRGSGRLNDEPASPSFSTQTSAIAHRGSGRVLPLFL